jgi:hypothetical protein
MGLEGASFRLPEFVGVPLAPGIKHWAGTLPKGKVRSKFWVGQEVEKEILVEEGA